MARQEQGEMKRSDIRGSSQVKGQNPKQNDSPDRDENHDENRMNPLQGRRPN